MTEEKSKAQAIRDYIKAHPRSKQKTIVSELAKNGIEVTPKYVSSIKRGKKKVRRSSVSKGKKSGARPYPQRTLEEALVIPQAIREENNGNPWITEDVAKAALGVTKKNNKLNERY